MTHHLFLLLLLLYISPTKTQQVASSPGVLQFALLAKEVPGTLRDTAIDSSGNLYAAGRDSSNAFVSKRSPSLNRLWVTPLPSLSDAYAAIAFSDTGGLFAIAASAPPNLDPQATDSANIADVILYELNTLTGQVISSALVERVQLSSTSHVRCILTSAAPSPPLVYVTYIVQDGVAPSTARTRVVQMARADTGTFSLVWKRELTDQDRVATSFGMVEDKARGRIVILEISSAVTGGITDQISAYVLDKEGNTTHNAKTMAASEGAWISNVAADENGALYVGEGPGLLHRIALRSLDGEDLLTKLWNVTETEVVDMTVLNNGSAIYVLSNGEGFRNEGTQVVRTKMPILSVYNESGHSLFKSEYIESVPDSKRETYSLSLIDPENQCDAVLGGFVRLAGAIADERTVSIGLFTFPNVAKDRQDQDDQGNPTDIDPNLPNSSDPETNATLVVVGASVGVAVFLSVVALALFIIYRKNNQPEADEHLVAAQDEQAVEDSSSLRASLRDNNVLV